jgi:hypothetical protein
MYTIHSICFFFLCFFFGLLNLRMLGYQVECVMSCDYKSGAQPDNLEVIVHVSDKNA